MRLLLGLILVLLACGLPRQVLGDASSAASQSTTQVESEEQVRAHARARIPGWDSLISSAADKLWDRIKSGFDGVANSIKTEVENDVNAVKATATKATSDLKADIVRQGKNAIDLAASPIADFGKKLQGLEDDAKSQISDLKATLAAQQQVLAEFAKAVAAYFTNVFDVSGKVPNCEAPTIFAELDIFFDSYLGTKPFADKTKWCRFMKYAALLKLDGTLKKMFTFSSSFYLSPPAFIETGETVDISVLGSKVNWNVANSVIEAFDGAFDILGDVLAAVDSDPVEEGAADAASGGSADPEVAQLIAAGVGVLFKLTSSSLKAAALSYNCQ